MVQQWGKYNGTEKYRRYQNRIPDAHSQDPLPVFCFFWHEKKNALTVVRITRAVKMGIGPFNGA